MTREEIMSYLDTQYSPLKNKNSLTKIHFSRSHSLVVYFLKKNQTEELMERDKCVIYSLDDQEHEIIMDGGIIRRLNAIS
jgi:hypothetical protein